MAEFLVETKQLTKTYGRIIALDHVSLRVRQGSIYGLIGDNGAGKTTLLKLLSGQAHTDSGELWMFGAYGEKELRRRRRQTGVIIEQPAFYGGMTVEKMMEYYRILKGVPGKGRVEETLRAVDIWDKRKSKCKNLSHGMKQRLSLAIAMISEPQLLILDEPVNGLDPSGIIEMRNLFRRLNEEKNITIILSSHILTELQQTASVFGFLSKGKLLEEISAKDLSEKCADYIEIAVSDTEKFAAILDGVRPRESCSVMPDKTIKIFNSGNKPEFFSRLAADNQIYIKRLEKMHTALENYYQKLKERGA